MLVARILYPVKTLGPGSRIGMWLCGCTHKCSGCSNPELWERQEKYRISVDDLLRLIHSISDNNKVDGFTITGGDPMQQPEELALLLPELRKISRDILVYTGYTLEELREMRSECVDRALNNIAVLIDGRYIAERNNGCPLRGSDNQRVIYIDEGFRGAYEEYMRRGNEIQNFTAGNSVISVGIHSADYPEQLERRLSEKNLLKGNENE
ncbi:MAG: 4Fe-4S cluster-binding domain-containing protein [Oscillospiraceae bacterium]|nr:4Fe-4S cluster-binding domain-containing protein [Oscillospiraceae bacterium]